MSSPPDPIPGGARTRAWPTSPTRTGTPGPCRRSVADDRAHGPGPARDVDDRARGLAVGLATSAYVPRRDALEQATTVVRLFREQPQLWQMHDLLLLNQDNLELDDILSYAATLGLDLERFRTDLTAHDFAARIAQDVDSAERSGVAGTPTFFINSHRHDGPQDLPTLTDAIRQTLATAT
ncbi:thioredoxin domain-containing protein [Kribbella sp. NPDC026596]|uniref:DsbA family protein n=1 Tax=Kribbella sp. NPDC026596 TaxID=3155122 RepID=UPI0033C61E9A